MKKLMFTFVVFAIILTSCPHKKKPGADNKPVAHPSLKGTTWESSDYQVIEFSNDTNLAILKNPSYPFGLNLEAPYEIKDEKVIIKLDNFISQLENFDDREFAKAYRVLVVDPTIVAYQFGIDDSETPGGLKDVMKKNIVKLKNGLTYLTDKAGIKKFIIEIFFPINIEEIEWHLANSTNLPPDAKQKMEEELKKMKGMLADTSKIDAWMEEAHNELKGIINANLPGIKASNPITLKSEDGETLKTTAKLISSSDFTVEALPFMSPIKFGDGDEFIKKK